MPKKLRKKKPPPSSTAPDNNQQELIVPGEVEFRCSEDDAWYTVSLRLEDGQCLRVSFTYFNGSTDENFTVEEFEDIDKLEIFRRRFRFSSVQLQDSDCWKMKKGMKICCSCNIVSTGALKFFDAVVRSVLRYDHEFPEIEEDEEEVCTCVFKILWQNGPHCGNITSSRIENICLIQEQTDNFHPDLTLFLNLAREKILLRTSAISDYISDKQMVDTFDKDTDLVSISLSSAVTDSSETYYSVFIENLEMDTSPKNIVDFVFKQTSVWSQALIFPSAFADIFQRGVIIVKTGQMIMKIINFLHDPSHTIVSSRGRPWIMLQKRWHCNSLGNVLLKNTLLHHFSQPHSNPDDLTGIKVVEEGSAEFERAKDLTDLFFEFYNHVNALHERFGIEQRKLFAS
ncbi:hypothetical protein ZOSMA_350G00100 [Zostera marina]|uniref:SAWADEE domain-containing protein n=1 Tax=Zostera marina TaxID=29655 RepID=A0A0K9P6T7_ZOSMR|nr:hypothetical protein ZOSMA_350G00100 [Zostera marina]